MKGVRAIKPTESPTAQLRTNFGYSATSAGVCQVSVKAPMLATQNEVVIATIKYRKTSPTDRKGESGGRMRRRMKAPPEYPAVMTRHETQNAAERGDWW